MRHLLPLLTFLISSTIYAQNTQTIRGKINDSESKIPLFAVSVTLQLPDQLLGAETDEDGYFTIENIPVGRQTLRFESFGYEVKVIDQILVTSGKEVYLEVELVETLEKLNEVVVKAGKKDNRPLNEMATVSARSFSVEETQRYAASAFDPARMAQNFGGVTSSGNDLMNEISIRGNSPKGILWRIEGVEVPNPNHFGSMGSSGGGISMLSSSTLAQSDFYTGAFPAEFGNASSGVFDIRLRKGNNQNREHSIMIGGLGIEASTEGYFKKGSNASYLLNYRYSTLGLISHFYNPAGDILPKYQDLSFNINLPTKKAGTFSLFGVGGLNSSIVNEEADSSMWDGDEYGSNFQEKQGVGTAGLKHFYLINEKLYVKSVYVQSVNHFTDETSRMTAEENYVPQLIDKTLFLDQVSRLSTMFNYKYDAKNTIRFGAIYGHTFYRFQYDSKELDNDVWINYLNKKGNAGSAQAYVQWKHRFSKKITSNLGIHSHYLLFNNSYSLEPRASIEWKASDRHLFAFATGIHARPEHISTYLLENGNGNNQTTPNKNMEIAKSVHVVGKYQWQIANGVSLKAEPYYQYLYDVAVENSPASTFSILNATDVWDLVNTDSLVTEGKGQNVGIDVVMQRSFNNGLYYLLAASVYDSKYATKDNRWYNTKFNGNYSLNLVGGKEFTVHGKNVLGINGKVMTTGGNRTTPIDLEASRLAGQGVYQTDLSYTDRLGRYFRLDIGVSYKINRPNKTHTFLIDVQNVTNNNNVGGRYYDSKSGAMKQYTQTGLFPFINYRLELKSK